MEIKKIFARPTPTWKRLVSMSVFPVPARHIEQI
jgi:hypothetical protein